MNRRTFLISAAAMPAALGACTNGSGDSAADSDGAVMNAGRTLERIGVQLYTVRSLMENDFEGTIRQVAALGYKEVEFAGYYDRSPEDIHALLEESGLTAPATHILIEDMRADLAGIIEMAKAMGHTYVVCPYLSEEERTLEHYRQHAMFFNEAGAYCQENGLQFAYHNHDFEFFPTDGVIPYDILLADTDPDLVKLELDLYWTTKAGVSATDLFARQPGRFPCVHVKDMGPAEEMVQVGQGSIDFAELFSYSDQAGVQHYFVEHDHPEDPMQSVTGAIAHLRTLTF